MAGGDIRPRREAHDARCAGICRDIRLGGAHLPLSLRGSVGDDRAVDGISTQQAYRKSRAKAGSEIRAFRDVQPSRPSAWHGADAELSVAVSRTLAARRSDEPAHPAGALQLRQAAPG